MRAALAALLLAALGGCGKEDAAVPLLHMRADSPETVEEAARAVERAGVTVKVVAISDLAPDAIPDWLASEKEGWVLVGKAGDRKRAEDALAAWWRESEARSLPPLEPVVPGTRAPAPDEVETIRRELARRRAVDQAVRTDPGRRSGMADVDADNTRYLRGVVADVGWIDAGRFGQPAADAAFLLVQHSGDLALMLAVLPGIERDVRAGAVNGQNYALLYDRTQLMSGGNQRYGTQVRAEDGASVVPRLEDPDGVDERRRALGLGPLREYLRRFGPDVRIEPAPPR